MKPGRRAAASPTLSPGASRRGERAPAAGRAPGAETARVRRAALVALVGLPLALALAAPAAAFPGLSVVYTRKEAAATIYDGQPDLAGLTEAIRQHPVVGDPRWPSTWLAGKVNGRELAYMNAGQMLEALRRGWQNEEVGDLVAVDELVARDWTVKRAALLRRALETLGPDAERVVMYVGPSLVSQIGRADLRRPLAPHLEAVLRALRMVGAVQLEMYQGGGIPWTRAQFAAYATRWLERFAPGDTSKLHLLMGPARVAATHAELWSRARSTPAGRAILHNGVGVWGLHGEVEGLEWLRGYREYLADPNAPPPEGDVAVPTGGGLGLAATGERRVTVRLSRPARAIISLRPVGSDRLRVIAKVRGPMRPRMIRLPADVRPGRYRLKAVAQGDGLKDTVDIPFRVKRPRAQSVPDPRVQGADGGAAATRIAGPSRRAELLRGLITLDGRFRLRLREAAECSGRGLEAERELRRRAVDGAVILREAGLAERLELLGSGVAALERVVEACRPGTRPGAPPALSPPAPSTGPAAPSETVRAQADITVADILGGRAIDVSATLGARVLPSTLSPVDLAALDGPACRAAGAICLGLDRPQLDALLRQLLQQNALQNTLRNLLGNLFGGGAAPPPVPAGDLSLSVGVQRLDDRTLRLTPTGAIAALAGLANPPRTVVGRLQVVAQVTGGAAAAPRPEVSDFRPGTAPVERRLLMALNAARAERGLPPLRGSAVLARPARRHSAVLARLGSLTHTSGRSPFWTRLVAAGYPPRRAMGENLARVPGCDPAGAEETVRLWLASPPHRANMLARGFRAVGIGASTDEDCTQTVYTADFGG